MYIYIYVCGLAFLSFSSRSQYILEYTSAGECIPVYWDTHVYGNAFTYVGVPQYMGMHSQILGHPSMWACIPIYWGTPVHGNAFAYMVIPQFMGKHPHILRVAECEVEYCVA